MLAAWALRAVGALTVDDLAGVISSFNSLLSVWVKSEMHLHVNCAMGDRWLDGQARFPTNGYLKGIC